MPPRRVKLLDELVRTRPDIQDPLNQITEGRVTVDGAFVTNPSSLVIPGSAITIKDPKPLRGEAKLRFALEHFSIDVSGGTALDAGAAAGGFTKVLLEKGAAKVYAVDTGHGQLIGSLRQDPRVVNLEGVNLGGLNPKLVLDPLEVITLDLSYLSLAKAVRELKKVHLAPGCHLVALVKPMFELSLSAPPEDQESLDRAADLAGAAAAADGWEIKGFVPSPVTGTRGAKEVLMHATH
ncbi:MAG TPA: SAM-dependent methyltransferase [Actinomycetota bacterium]|nr:SAM-dependent methyltransferase [Actinomycetota bacterium]